MVASKSLASLRLRPSQARVRSAPDPIRAPAFGQEHEAFGAIGSLDDFDGPFAQFAQCFLELWSGMAAAGDAMSESRTKLFH